METLLHDLRYGLRTLLKAPGFTAVAVAALALGIGSSAAMFTVVHAVLLRPLPYSEPDRLVLVFEAIPRARSGPIGFSPPDYAVLERQSLASIAEVGAFSNKQYELSGAGEPERVTGARVSPSVFSLLGVAPALGQSFTREHDQPGSNVVILSHGLWQRKYGADPAVVGRSVTLDRQPHTIVGVMPRGFAFPQRGPRSNNQPADLWVPIAFTPSELRAWSSMYNHTVLGRLRPGATLQQARAEMLAAARRIEEHYPATGKLELSTTVEPYHAQVVGPTEPLLFALAAAVGMVLLIGCADVANLLLGRAGERQREIAVRLALGAARTRLVRQLLTENLLLAIAGGGLGLVLAAWGTRLLVQFSPVHLPRASEIRLDAGAVGFALLLSAGTILLFGLVPAVEGSRANLGAALGEGGRSATAGPRRRRLVAALAALQFALALVLLVGAGLLARSFLALTSVDPGFRAEQVLSLSVSLPASRYGRADQIRSFYQRLLEGAEAVPGVKAVGATTDLPLVVRERRSFTPETTTAAAAGIPRVVANVWVLGAYLETLRVPLVKGRTFTASDGRSGERAAIVNETMAARYWPGQDPVGQRMKWGGQRSTVPWMTIVGVVRDVKPGALDDETVPQAYEPYMQASDGLVEENNVGMLRSLALVVRAEREPAGLARTLREQIRGLDPALPVVNVQTLEAHVGKSVAPQRFNAFIVGAFAAFALLLAAIGIYGVMSRSVSQRGHEIGVRMALGARRSDLVAMVVREGMVVVGCGAAVGIAAALALTRLLSSLLFGVRPYDPSTFVAVVALLGTVALAACYVPARRAAQVDLRSLW